MAVANGVMYFCVKKYSTTQNFCLLAKEEKDRIKEEGYKDVWYDCFLVFSSYENFEDRKIREKVFKDVTLHNDITVIHEQDVNWRIK